MITGSCHCGAVKWELDGVPTAATTCNCTICRRYGALWAYDYENEGIRIDAEPNAVGMYAWGEKSIGFHFCKVCACVTHWRGIEAGKGGRRRIAVNLRNAEPLDVADIPLRRFDGSRTWQDLPDNGQHVADVLWT
jgi:hypothetical protein